MEFNCKVDFVAPLRSEIVNLRKGLTIIKDSGTPSQITSVSLRGDNRDRRLSGTAENITSFVNVGGQNGFDALQYIVA